MGTASFSVPLVGRFNALNAVAALGIGLLLGIPLQEMAAAFEQVNGAPGRMERVGALNGLTVVVDYAHTPDALRGALLSLRELTDGRVGVVFGCGGDRDREKRPLMGRIAEELADYVVVTSDNPRTEPPRKSSKIFWRGLTRCQRILKYRVKRPLLGVSNMVVAVICY